MNARAVVVLSVVLVSCGGDGSEGDSKTSITSPAPPTTQLIQQGNFTLSAPTGDAYFFGLTEITTTSAGTWETTVDWTFPTNTLHIYVATGSCTPTQFATEDCPSGATCPCQFAIRSEVATPKPRVLTLANAAPGTRTLIILNLGPEAESGNYAVRLTPAGTSSTTSLQATDPPAPSVAAKRRVR